MTTAVEMLGNKHGKPDALFNNAASLQRPKTDDVAEVKGGPNAGFDNCVTSQRPRDQKAFAPLSRKESSWLRAMPR
ncbi:hypothetical protein Trco_004906 [Trichoderma cornu-damae]|uniref:Uncharacterized protein n=1 Tax=Trichoderma cornu-damae TaxID=654480 RepID=A0A9P8TUV9_9HYPO|nr:hypothetical protein Trco_004906 [Trichoderma cornu-damae]